MSGFEFRETMSGSYRLASAPDHERAISFTVGARVQKLGRFLRDKQAAIQGAIEMEGFAAHRPCRGTMVMDPVLGKKVGYDLTFVDDAGRTHRLVGQKDVSFLRLLETMTTLPAELFDDAGNKIGTATLRFDARSDLAKFLKSFRPLRLA